MATRSDINHALERERIAAGTRRAGGNRPGGARQSAEAEYQQLLRRAFLGGRWALLLGEAASLILRSAHLRASGFPADLAAAVLLGYNLVAIAFLMRKPWSSATMSLVLLAGDLITIGALVGLSGGLGSPFAGLFFLVVLAAAIHQGLRGALIAALGAVLVLVVAAHPGPDLWAELRPAVSEPSTCRTCSCMGHSPVTW